MLQLTGGGTGSADDSGSSAKPSFVPFEKGAASLQYDMSMLSILGAGMAAVLSGAWIIGGQI